MIKIWNLKFDDSKLFFDTDEKQYMLQFTCCQKTVKININDKTAKMLLDKLPFEVLE